MINNDDITYVKSILGNPSQFSLDDEEPRSNQNNHSHTYKNPPKKLYRDPHNKKLGGVAAGVAHYLNIDPSWVRIALICIPFLDFLFLGISTTTIVLAYIILWIVVPEAKTTSEILEMCGDDVNVDSLRQFDRNKNKKK